MTHTASRPRTTYPVATERKHTRTGAVMKVFGAVIAAVAVALVLLAGSVVTAGRSYDETRSDAIVILGAAQYWGDPSPVFKNRLAHASELYRKGVAPAIITVGGGIPGDKTTEAAAGAEYLKKQGVPESAIVAIPQGSDTINSMEAVAAYADAQDWESLTLVSDRDHVARSAAIARGLGLHTYTNAPAAGDGSKFTFEQVGFETMGLVRFYLWDRWQLDAPAE